MLSEIRFGNVCLFAVDGSVYAILPVLIHPSISISFYLSIYIYIYTHTFLEESIRETIRSSLMWSCSSFFHLKIWWTFVCLFSGEHSKSAHIYIYNLYMCCCSWPMPCSRAPRKAGCSAESVYIIPSKWKALEMPIPKSSVLF